MPTPVPVGDVLVVYVSVPVLLLMADAHAVNDATIGLARRMLPALVSGACVLPAVKCQPVAGPYHSPAAIERCRRWL